MLPNFTNLDFNTITKTVSDFLIANRQKIAVISKQPASWQTIFAPLEQLDNELNNYWSVVSHLNAVQNSPELREIYNKCLPKLSEYATEIKQNKALFEAAKSIKNSEEFLMLSTEQQTIINNSLRDFRLSGINLSDDKQQELKAINLKLSKLSSQFDENILDCTNVWRKNIQDMDLLKGIPEATLNFAKKEAESNGETGFSLTLDFPIFHTVMQYADNRNLRFEFYQAYITRASDQGIHNKKYDNSKIMQKLLALRQQKAKILGFETYAQLSIATKMADSRETVFEFLNNLLDKSISQAKAEFTTLKQFAKDDGITDFSPWDVAYYSEKLKQKLFNFDAESLKPWFPINKVLSGLFSITKQLFQVDIIEIKSADVWHKDIKVFEIQHQNGTTKAYFYLDLYARKNKRGGAWMDVCREQIILKNGNLQLPIAYLSCNFSQPESDKPALLTHDELTTLFHEFGHGIHHMLSEIQLPSVGGISGVPWDAVELPSQFMENFCWQAEVLPIISGHFKTNKPLPDNKLSALLYAKNFQCALAMVRQLEFALFDFTLYDNFSDEPDLVENTLRNIQQKTALMSKPKWARFANSFSHIFGGGYAAGYYSYKWAEVLSADAFSLFEKNGILDKNTGQKFLNSILQKGGSVDVMDLFVQFRGRKPDISALLRHSGINS